MGFTIPVNPFKEPNFTTKKLVLQSKCTYVVDQVVLQKQISKSIQRKKPNMFHVFMQTRFVVGPGEELFCTLAHSLGTFTTKRNIYFCNLAQTRTFQCVRIIAIWTQVGSPAVRLRLARCTAWVKRWSKAMDFFQTIFKTNISLSGIFENYIIKG